MIIRPFYTDIHLSCALCSMIGQMQTSSYQLEIKVGRNAQIPLEERICQLRHQGVESDKHYVCDCTVFYEGRGRYHCLLKKSSEPTVLGAPGQNIANRLQ